MLDIWMSMWCVSNFIAIMIPCLIRLEQLWARSLSRRYRSQDKFGQQEPKKRSQQKSPLLELDRLLGGPFRGFQKKILSSSSEFWARLVSIFRYVDFGPVGNHETRWNPPTVPKEKSFFFLTPQCAGPFEAEFNRHFFKCMLFTF